MVFVRYGHSRPTSKSTGPAKSGGPVICSVRPQEPAQLFHVRQVLAAVAWRALSGNPALQQLARIG